MYALIYTDHLYTNKVKNIRFHNSYIYILRFKFRFTTIYTRNKFRFETNTFRFKQNNNAERFARHYYPITITIINNQSSDQYHPIY